MLGTFFMIGSINVTQAAGLVDRGGFQSHEWKRVERLEAVWELAKRGLGSSGSALILDSPGW